MGLSFSLIPGSRERKLIRGEITSPRQLHPRTGPEINTFTANQDKVRRFYALYIDGIIVNYPDMTKRVPAECAAEYSLVNTVQERKVGLTS